VSFEGVLGQPHAVHFLKHAVEADRVAHAYAFVGPSGVGRRLTALAFAQRLLCPAGRGCGSCPSCRRVSALTHPDLHLIQPTPPPDNPKGGVAIRIAEARALVHGAGLYPLEGAWKVFILDDAERMTLETVNALLKTLEEPPPRTILVLILGHVRLLPATVLSRCQVVRFRPLADELVIELLTGRANLAEETARVLARVAQGRIGLALTAATDGWLEDRDRLITQLLEGRVDEIFALAEEVGRDRARVERLVELCWFWFRDLLILKGGGGPGLLMNGDRADALSAQARLHSLEAIASCLDQVKAVWAGLQGNVSPRLSLEVALTHLAMSEAA